LRGVVKLSFLNFETGDEIITSVVIKYDLYNNIVETESNKYDVSSINFDFLKFLKSQGHNLSN